jgi:Flp pilus assembly pilin Flp
MKLMMALQRRDFNFTCGQTMTEYVLIVSAVAIASVSTYRVFGTTLTTMVKGVAAGL